ncbi:MULTISPECIES: STAS domain-containing protein [Mesonia]|uniref:Uncharacterized protein n=1 Tax=Mesonia oceanica TaxID=2687242 RepID=A0AC61Y866_9FLAO|nr:MULTISPECIES: STAS domain-containing protein [Mesonia]MAN27727.1 hypothetical protein [Mesonia sp.]MAQ39670.1 hypothetical protein [Mesonia sp.]VVU99569.1 hypothetical protein FVB9532_00824 [Mesonia oceanica]|tara:strand:- start:31559 stop:31867 length:309 start_codon:yes stop_codon:yes gene_type:complete
MAFFIKQNNELVQLSGNLTVSTAHLVRTHIETLLKNIDFFTIDLSEIDSIDTGSVLELRSLVETAFKKGKKIAFMGKQNQKIIGAFKRCNVNLFKGKFTIAA